MIGADCIHDAFLKGKLNQHLNPWAVNLVSLLTTKKTSVFFRWAWLQLWDVKVNNFFQICSLTLQVSYVFVQKSRPENQPTKLSPCRPSEFWRFQRQGQGESGDSTFFDDRGLRWNTLAFLFETLEKSREILDFLPQLFLGGEMNSLRVQFQSCQLNLCEQKSRNLVGHLFQTRRVLKNAGFFRHLKEKELIQFFLSLTFSLYHVLNRFSISRCANLARFCVSTHETGERSLWMTEPTSFFRRFLRRVIG